MWTKMKKTLLTILPLLLIIGCSKKEPLNYELLEERDGVHYQKSTNEIYSGPVFNIDGKSEGYLKNGKRDGLWKEWYENGQIKRERYFKDGVVDGLVTTWFQNGQKETESYSKDGRHDYRRGSSWYESGMKRSEYMNRDTSIVYYENGQIQRLNFHKDEDIHVDESIFYYENRQVRLEGNFNKLTTDGLWTYYDKKGNNYKGNMVNIFMTKFKSTIDLMTSLQNGLINIENGNYIISDGVFFNVERTFSWKDGKFDGLFTIHKNGQKRMEGTINQRSGDQYGRVGKWTIFNEDGSIRRVLDCNNWWECDKLSF